MIHRIRCMRGTWILALLVLFTSLPSHAQKGTIGMLKPGDSIHGSATDSGTIADPQTPDDSDEDENADVD